MFEPGFISAPDWSAARLHLGARLVGAVGVVSDVVRWDFVSADDDEGHDGDFGR